jgi:hypothetical protein
VRKGKQLETSGREEKRREKKEKKGSLSFFLRNDSIIKCLKHCVKFELTTEDTRYKAFEGRGTNTYFGMKSKPLGSETNIAPEPASQAKPSTSRKQIVCSASESVGEKKLKKKWLRMSFRFVSPGRAHIIGESGPMIEKTIAKTFEGFCILFSFFFFRVVLR